MSRIRIFGSRLGGVQFQRFQRFQSTSALSRPASLKDFVISQYTKETPHFDVELPTWQKVLGDRFINVFGIDMDKVRSGPVGGRVFRDLCKAQGFYPGMIQRKPTASPVEELSPRARFYYDTLGLPQTYQQWFQIDALHIWMLYVRLRVLPRKYCREYQKKMINAIFEEIGFQLRQDVKVPSDRAINSYMKQFNDQLRGAIFAYDEGFYTSDTSLAGALWRNLFNSSPEVDMAKLEQMVHYIRTQLYVFSRVSDRDFAFGRVGFVEPWGRYEPLTEAEEKEIRDAADATRAHEVVRSNLSVEGW